MSDRTYRLAIAAGKVALRGLDLRVREEGSEHVPTVGPVVLACNHVSFPDFVFVGQALLGTIAYLSPELVTRGIADTRSDVYAMGIMMYEMLVGEQPFRGEQPV